MTGPPNLPVYGAYWIVLASEFNNLAGAFKRLGEWYQTKMVGLFLGPVPAVIVNDPAMIKEVLNSEDFDGRMDIILGRLRSYWKKLGECSIDFNFIRWIAIISLSSYINK